MMDENERNENVFWSSFKVRTLTREKTLKKVVTVASRDGVSTRIQKSQHIEKLCCITVVDEEV